MLMRYAERMWQGEVGMEGLINGEVPSGVAFEIADGVAVVPSFANVTVFRTEEGLVLFDTGAPNTAKSNHRAIREWCPDPVRYAVYSHGHIDHVFGVGPFDEEADRGGAERPVVIAHEAVKARFERYVLTKDYNRTVNARQFANPRFRWPEKFRYPEITYRDDHRLRVGELTFELRHARGETDDHTWAYVPERDIILAGDLFIWNSPNCGNPQKVQRYPAEWAAALRAMAELDASLLIPGHGAPIAGRDRVRTALTDVAEYLETLVSQTLALMNGGARLDEIIHAVHVPERLAAKPYLRAAYDEPEFIVRNIWRLYGGWWDGDPAALKPPRADRLATVLAELAGGPHDLADRARRALDDDEPRVAARLIELARQAAPEDEDVRDAYRQIFTALAESATSLMTRGIYLAAAKS
ncbi:alkyl sulfatase dimerization domain-containing protein [Actinomadura sp. WMMA1423]|uniref:alkyl sulfatase dimerization domain-containing protein n=1 Tax=Actinomadura sp. WMMA1423 TaxID=2591108 RepID=UPI0011462824|nr:alkyl sulfatase dimerization domain-containing protein [Actinomadura sp. WMMA1423]